MTDVATIRSRKAEYQQRVVAIRRDPRTSAERKQALLAREYVTLRTYLDRERASGQREAQARAVNVQQRLFGSVNAIDPATAISFRDAAERADTTKETALALVQRALITGDQILARGALSAAFAHGWVDVVRAYADAYPKDAPLIDEAREVLFPDASEAGERRLAERLLYSTGSKPEELERFGDDDLQKLATSDIADDDPEPEYVALTSIV